jgi:hypothetical protein
MKHKFGVIGIKTAILLKLYEKGVNTYSPTICRGIKFLDKIDFPIEILAREFDLKVKQTRLSI